MKNQEILSSSLLATETAVLLKVQKSHTSFTFKLFLETSALVKERVTHIIVNDIWAGF